MISSEILLYVALGFAAQPIDGALGMAYGLVATSALLATGTPLAPAGIIGGVVGAYLLVGLPETWVKIFVTVYLLGIAVLITYRVFTKERKRTSAAEKERTVPTIPVGAAGGFLDAVGGGGWGPIVTSTLIARGDAPRHSIGSVSLAEFFVTLSISLAFLITLDLSKYGYVVVGLIIGGAMAAPLAGILSRVLPPRVLMTMVAVVVAAIGVHNVVRVAMG
jgi:uncharacterized membrane protein YfcA